MNKNIIQLNHELTRISSDNKVSLTEGEINQLTREYNDKLSERDNMINNGYRYYWDCGNTKWEYKKPPEISF